MIGGVLSPTDPVDVGSRVARLRTIIVVDVLTATAATCFMVVVYVAAVRSGFLLLAALLVAASGGLMALGLRPLRSGNVDRSMWCLACANWGIAISAATIATFCWPLMMLTALLPSVAAASLASGRHLAVYVAVSVAVSLGVVLVGLLQDFSGLSDATPSGVRNAVLIVFAPSLVGLMALMVLLNSVSTQRALSAAHSSRAEVVDQAEELRESRARVVAATDRERRRIERDLHDGAQQTLIAIGIGLSQAKELCHTDPDRAARSLDALRNELRSAHDELRDLAQGVYPPVLTEHGLPAALQSAADRCRIPVRASLHPVGRHRAEVEAAVYFCCVEALQNAVKHAEATSIGVSCWRDDEHLHLAVVDDGVGFDHGVTPSGNGIANLRDRLGSVGRTLEITRGGSSGTVVRGTVPVHPPVSGVAPGT